MTGAPYSKVFLIFAYAVYAILSGTGSQHFRKVELFTLTLYNFNTELSAFTSLAK